MSLSNKAKTSNDSSSFRNPQSAIRNSASALRTRLAERLRGAAFVLLLACVAGRAFLAEMPFRQSPVELSEVAACMNRGEPPQLDPVNRQELARTSLATILLAAGALWLIAGAIEGQLRVRYPWLAVILAAFAAWSFASAWRAVDARSAWMVWLEQISLMTAGFVTIQLCSSRRRFVLVAAVLAAVGLSLAMKGWMQLAWEHADAARDFQLYGPERLADMGLTSDDPRTRTYIQRLTSPKPTAWFGLPNVLASALALTLAAAAGLAVAKGIYTRFRRRRDGAMPPGHIRPAFLAAVLTVLALILVAAILVGTKSRGGIGAAAVMLVLTLIGLRFRATLARRWKLAIATVGVLLVLGAAGVISYGLARGRLPGGKTMSIRWFYWTGSAQIVREHPLCGVGPGNFPRAYLRLRRPEAEEAVKTPHNLLAHAFAQYGLPGGGLYLTILGGMLVLAWKPARKTTNEIHDAPKHSIQPLLWSCGCIVLGVFVCRYFFGDAATTPILLVLEGFVPAVLFAVALTLERWFAGPVEDAPDGSIRAIRIALTAGCSALVLHNFVSYSLWTPGTAGLFWVALGAVASGGEAREATLRRAAIPAALPGVVAVAAAGVILVSPVAKRLSHTRQAVEAMLRYDPRLAIHEAQQAARCDPHDAHAARDASRICLILGADRLRKHTGGDPLPMVWAREAIRRDDAAGSYRLSAQTAQQLKLPEAEEYWRGAIRRDPSDSRLRLDYAGWLIDNSQGSDAAVQLDEAQRIDRQLRAFNPESVFLFSRNEQKQIANLRRRITKK